MTSEINQNQTNTLERADSKELNFRKLEARYEKQLSEERQAREDLQRQIQEMQSRTQVDDDNYSEPYVDDKRLDKKLAKFGEQTQKQTQSEIQRAVQMALQEERKQNWIKQNPDFYDTLTNHAEKLYQVDPELAETILKMPEGFERQKLVYKNVKALGLDKPPQREPTIQEKIDSNRRSPYYQPSGIGTAPYSNSHDFSKEGQKRAYEKLQELKGRLGV